MKKNISILLVALLVFSLFCGTITASSENLERTVSKEITLYEWDLTNPGTFWSVSDGSSTPLTQTSGGGEHCNFKIDENGAYIQGLKDYPAYNTTGAASNVDMSDPTTKLVIEFETVNSAKVFLKASFDSAKPDDKGTLLEKSVDGFMRYEKNISSADTKFASLQLGVFPGGEVTFKTAKIVKTVTGPRADEVDATEQTVKEFNLTQENEEIIIHEKAQPVYGANGVTMTAGADWVGINTAAMKIDLSDVSTKLVIDVTNNESATLAIKYVSDNIFSAESGGFMGGELLLTSATGTIEVYLDRIFTREQLSALSKGNIVFQILIGSTGKTVTVHSFKIVKNTVPVFNQYVNLSNVRYYWNMQDMPTSAQYEQMGQTMPLTGSCATGEYILDTENKTMSIKATQESGTFWYGATLNSIKIDLNLNPKIKFTVVSSSNRWTMKIGKNDAYNVNLFDEYNNPITTGEVTVELKDYYNQILDPSTEQYGVINLGISFQTLYNNDNLPTVIKDLKIVYDNPAPLEEVTGTNEIVINTDTAEPAQLPIFLNVTSENYSDDIHVVWTAPDNYNPETPGTYVFSGVLDTEELMNKGFIANSPVTATVNIRELLRGDADGDGTISVKDLIRLKKYLAFSETTELYFNGADVDGDDEITSEDLAALTKLIMGA